MLWLAVSLALLQDPHAGHSHEQPAGPMLSANYLQGPLSIEIDALGENRVRFFPAGPDRANRAVLQMRLRMEGADLVNIRKFGNVIFESIQDNTGKSLISADTYTEEEKTGMKPQNAQAASLERDGLLMVATVDAPARDATHIANATGYVKVVMASDVEEIWIENPRGKRGAVLDDPRLIEKGIEIKLLEPSEAGVADHPTNIVIQTPKGDGNVAGIEFVDGWFKQQRTRIRSTNTPAGSPASVYTLIGKGLDADSIMVVRVYKTVQEQQVPIRLNEVELP